MKESKQPESVKTRIDSPKLKEAAETIREIEDLRYKVGAMTPQQLEDLTVHLKKAHDMMLV